MKHSTVVCRATRRLLMGNVLLFATTLALGQVSPVVILNPRLKADEARYLPQMQAIQQSIASVQFPFPFKLARYANARPGQSKASDANGIQFIYFEDREILKISGIYGAAYNVEQLSKNERASRTFQNVMIPILQIAAQQAPADIDCDGIGIEIVYNARDSNKAYDYEGREVLTAIFNLHDVFALANTSQNTERQKILNRSDIFVDGSSFGLALGQRDPLNVQALERSVPPQKRLSAMHAKSDAAVVFQQSAASPSVATAEAKPTSQPASTSAHTLRLQGQLQDQIDGIMKEYGAAFHLAATPPPSFEMRGDQTLLHFTMKNTLAFEKNTSSIYKRAAQSFDLFLAPELKGLLSKLPADAEYDALDFSVLNRMAGENASSETIEYVCPLNSVRAFVENKITSQDLINQSIVLMNGVRISLNLQLVE